MSSNANVSFSSAIDCLATSATAKHEESTAQETSSKSISLSTRDDKSGRMILESATQNTTVDSVSPEYKSCSKHW